MKTKTFSTGKFCCEKHKSIIQIKQESEIFSAECFDCGNIIKGENNVRNLLITTNELATRHLMNSANQN